MKYRIELAVGATEVDSPGYIVKAGSNVPICPQLCHFTADHFKFFLSCLAAVFNREIVYLRIGYTRSFIPKLSQ